MKRFMSLVLVVFCVSRLTAQAPPLVEKYLHSGDLSNGLLAVEKALRENPKNDELRFSLGMIQLISGVERLGQTMYHFGLKPANSQVPLLRFPIPLNPNPAEVSYQDLRRIMDVMYSELKQVEQTLAGITDDKVRLPLHMAKIQLDLTGEGKERVSLLKVLERSFGNAMNDMLKGNSELLICWDRADVAWFRGYCHVLMATIDVIMALDLEHEFNQYTHLSFVKPRTTDKKKDDKVFLSFKEPLRMGRCRLHLIEMCKLNHEVWKFARAEKDDDHEWLPNPKQIGVLRMPVKDEMIDAWLDAVDELKATLEGKKVFRMGKDENLGLSVKNLMENPPLILGDLGFLRDPAYLTPGDEIDSRKFFRVLQVFGNASAFAYAAWFN